MKLSVAKACVFYCDLNAPEKKEAGCEEFTKVRKRNVNSTQPPPAATPPEKKLCTCNSGPWSFDEDQSLRKAISSVPADCTDKGWSRIAQEVGSRTSVQCWQRWNLVLDPNSCLNKGAWGLDEDQRLLAAIKYQPNYQRVDWHAVETQVRTRRAMQCKDRWVNHLDPSLRRDSFTEEEYQAVWRLRIKYGNKFVKIASEIPGRSATKVKAAWRSMLRRNQRESHKAGLCMKISI
jgi:hypothetical protein